MSRPKVFGIGLNKTGTTTLGCCLTTLGYHHQSCRPDLLRAWEKGNKEEVLNEADRYDSAEDWPWPLIYRELYTRYPDAKFILTIRKSPETWLKSLKAHAKYTKPFFNCRKIAYGHSYPHFSEQAHIDFYNQHNREVMDFFATQDASDRLLVLCWERGDAWKELCEFLDIPIQSGPLPHANATKSRAASGNEALNHLLIGLKGFVNTISKPLLKH